jgi:ABC-type Fe3+/spermidine/putrescine transport system ATPase subunit
MFEIEGLSKSYDGTPIVKNVSLSCKKGSFHTIIGPSGAGKTTLLKLIAGLLPPDKGRLILDGEELEPQVDKLVPGYEEVQVVHQDFQLKANMTIRENLNYALLGYDLEYKKQRVEELINLCKLQKLVKREPYQLSGGQKQRVAIARALASEPEVILMDEPFSNLDPITKNELLQESREIAHKSETTILLVTHDTRDALEAADQIHILIDGSIHQEGEPKAVYSNPKSPQIANLMGYMNYLIEEHSLIGYWAEHLDLSDNGAYNGTIVKTIFKGPYQLLLVTSNLKKSPLLLFDFYKKRKAGDKVKFDLPPAQKVNFGSANKWAQWLPDL